MARSTILSGASLNRTVLARQMLLGRRRSSIPCALERVAGLQNQYAPTSYIGLWSRLADFRRNSLSRALERRSVVQGTLMRATIHLVSARDYPLMADALRDIRREWWARVSDSRGLDVDYPAMAREADLLLADGPLRRAELVERLEAAGYPRDAFEGLGLWIDLVRVPPSGTWERRRADIYQTATRWLGHLPGQVEGAMNHLVSRYLRAFGPASASDVASWAGCSVGAVTSRLDVLPLRRFRDEEGSVLVDLARQTVVAGDAPAPVRFLGPWEAILLAHARRSGVLAEELRPRVFSTKKPQSVGTFLVDGRVAGGWRAEGDDVRLEPFVAIPRRFRRSLEEETAGLRDFLGRPP